MEKHFKIMSCICLIIFTCGITSCSSSHVKISEDEIIETIETKYYSLRGKYDEITVKVTSSFLNNLIENSEDKRVENLRGIEFFAKLNKTGQLFIAVQNVPDNLATQDREFVDSAIEIMKKQINGIFLTISPVIGGIVNKDKYEVKVIANDKKQIIIRDKLKGSTGSDKLYFDNKLKLKKWEAFSGTTKVSSGAPTLEEKGGLIYFSAINAELYYPQNIKSENRIKYKEYKSVLLPYQIANRTFSNGNLQESTFTFEPIEMK